MVAGVSLAEIGQRLRAFRIGAELTPDALAARSGISRAAIYRYESGHAARIDTLASLAACLEVSLPTLLGVGMEYIPSAVAFFERMRQIEAVSDQICGLFGPVSYLLTTDAYDAALPEVLRESVPGDVADRARSLRDIATLMEVLHARKETHRRRGTSIVSLVSAAELTQFRHVGFVGAPFAEAGDSAARRHLAHTEIEHIVAMLRAPPIGTQIGLVVDSMPGASLQLFRQGENSQVAVSPFRLGFFANVRLGVATISAAPEAVELYGTMTEQLWARSLKGDQAADFIERRILAGDGVRNRPA